MDATDPPAEKQSSESNNNLGIVVEVLPPEVIAWAGELEETLASLSDVDKEVEKAKAFINMSK